MISLSRSIRTFPENKLTYIIGGILTAGWLSTSAVAATNTITLPNGTTCEVAITSPLSGQVFKLPVGQSSLDLKVEGLANVGQANLSPSSIVYVVDVSASTSASIVPTNRCSTILSCEQAFVKDLNQEIVNKASGHEVGSVVYGYVSSIADMSPAIGEQKIITPESPGKKPFYVDNLMDSTFSGGGVQLYSPKSVGGSTNCRAGLENALTVINSAHHENKIVVFLSDGICNRGGRDGFNLAVKALADAGVVAHSIAVGSESSCTIDMGHGSLQAIANGTGGQCFTISQVGSLSNLIPTLVGSSLESLGMTVDGKSQGVISNNDINPDLPQRPGPASANYASLALKLGVGMHELCVSAYCSESLGGADQAIQCETIEVKGNNQQPIANEDIYNTATEDTPFEVAAPGVLKNDSDPDGDPLTVTTATSPSYGKVTQKTDGSVTYVAAPNFCGTDSYSYTISDGRGGTATAKVSIQVTCVNDPPLAVDDAYTTNEDTLLNVEVPGVLKNDSDVEGDSLTASVASSPSHGKVTQKTDGSLTYLPAPDFCGTDSYTYTLADGQGGTATAKVTLTVNCINDPPVATADTYTTNEDTVLTVAASTGVLKNDSDAENDPLTVSASTSPSQGTLKQNADGSLTYTPSANFCGVDNYTYTLSDGKSSSIGKVALQVTCVNDPPLAIDDAYTTDEDTPLNVEAPGILKNDSDVDQEPLTVSLATPPSQGEVKLTQNGSFSYTPVTNFCGSDSYTYTLADSQGGTATAKVTLTVNCINDPPVATADTYTTNEDTVLTVAASMGVLKNDLDAENDPLTVSAATSPSQGTLKQNADGSLTYTPSANFCGVDNYTYTLSDGKSTSVGKVTLQITCVNDPPLAIDDAYTTDEDTPLNVEAPGVLKNDSDVDGDALKVTAATSPSQGTLKQNADGSLTYLPKLNFCGSDSYTYTLADGQGGAATAKVTLTVSCINDPPVATNDTYTTNEDTVLTVAASTGVLKNDLDAENDPLTVSASTSPSQGTLKQNADGSLTYTPSANFCGVDNYTYTLSDGKSTSVGKITLVVTCINDLPVAVQDAYTTDEDTPLNVNAPGVLKNDSDVDGDALKVTAATSPSQGTLKQNADGSLTYLPKLNFCGSDSYTYTLADSQGGTATAKVTLTVNCINDPPVATDDIYTTNEDTVLTVGATIGVLKNDSDVEGDVLKVNSASTPSQGTLKQNSDGSLTYTPNKDFCGSDGYTYTVADSKGNTNVGKVTINVTCVNDVPVAIDDTYVTYEDVPFTLFTAYGVLSNDVDGDGDSLKVIASTPTKSGMLRQNADGSLTYTPVANFCGTDKYTYTLSDGKASDIGDVVIQVQCVNDPPVPQGDAYTATENTLLKVAATGVLGNDTDPVEKHPLSAPRCDATSVYGGTITSATNGSFTYKAATGFAGIDTFECTVCDNPPAGSTVNGSLCSNSKVTMTVNPKSNRIAEVDLRSFTSDSTTFNGNFTVKNMSGKDIQVQLINFEVRVEYRMLRDKGWFPLTLKPGTCSFSPSSPLVLAANQTVSINFLGCELNSKKPAEAEFRVTARAQIFSKGNSSTWWYWDNTL